MRPATSMAPASPARPPESSATSSVVRVTDTPAKAAARGLAPTARMSKPSTLYFISAHNATASVMPHSSPVCRRVCAISLDSSSSPISATLCGQPRALGSFMAPSSISDTPSSTMKFSSRVVTTSSTPNFAFNSAGPSNNNAPASAAAVIIRTNSSPGGSSNPVPPCKPPTATAASAPAYNCPSAPMLNNRALNATAAANPVSISGMARVRVSLSANTEPKPPLSSSA